MLIEVFPSEPEVIEEFERFKSLVPKKLHDIVDEFYLLGKNVPREKSMVQIYDQAILALHESFIICEYSGKNVKNPYPDEIEKDIWDCAVDHAHRYIAANRILKKLSVSSDNRTELLLGCASALSYHLGRSKSLLNFQPVKEKVFSHMQWSDYFLEGYILDL